MSQPPRTLRGHDQQGGNRTVKNVPNIAWACLTLAFVAVLVAFVTLSVTGSDPTEFRSFLNTVVNLATLLVSGGAVVFAGKASQQTNGGLDQRIKDGAKDAVVEALNEQRTADGGVVR